MSFTRPKWPDWDAAGRNFRRWVAYIPLASRAGYKGFVTLHGPACKEPSEPDFGQGDTIFGGNIDPMNTPYPPQDPVLASFCSEYWRFKI